MKNRTVLVCGGRKYGASMQEVEAVFKVLHGLHDKYNIVRVVQGGAKGADALAKEWAEVNSVECVEYKPDWKHYGRSAGIRRNAEMLEKENVDLVVAFPGGIGTADMVHKALLKDIAIVRIEK